MCISVQFNDFVHGLLWFNFNFICAYGPFCFCPVRFFNTKFCHHFIFVFTVCQSQMLKITEACGVLIKYILSKIEKTSISETKLLLPALKSLCEGKSQDQDCDRIVLSSILRNAKQPEHKANVTGNV